MARTERKGTERGLSEPSNGMNPIVSLGNSPLNGRWAFSPRLSRESNGEMSMRQIQSIIVLVAVFLSYAGGSFAESRMPIDQVPMYGGMDRSAVKELREADEQFIEGTTKAFGSREKASAAFVDRAFRLYGQDDIVGAMRRFNQAWLLNPNNPEVYWGFASVLHDQGKTCEAMKMMEKALSFNLYIDGLYPDAGRLMTLCASADSSLTAGQKKQLYDKADLLYSEAETKDRDKGYVYASWASAYYWRSRYDDAWMMVKKAKEAGGSLPEPFLEQLRSKMAEP
jgi:tetratricopeptide (TPR) repeat protein